MASISLKYKSKSGNLTAPGDVDPGAMIPLMTTTLGSNAASVTFSSIPQGYEHLQIRLSAHTTRATGGVGGEVYLNFNSDTSANYGSHWLRGNGTSATGAGYASQTLPLMARVGTDGYGSAYFGSSIIDVLDYSNTNKYKTSRSIAGYDGNGSGEIWLFSSLWMNTNAITSLTISTDYLFTANSHFAIYGIKRAGA